MLFLKVAQNVASKNARKLKCAIMWPSPVKADLNFFSSTTAGLSAPFLSRCKPRTRKSGHPS